ncbi:MAG: domain containing protein [Pedosphaera sp.]|nr:domain containing protein [Pedosphaera sp.]
MKTKRFRIVSAMLIVAMVGGIGWQVLRPQEPVYQGKRLSAWLAELDKEMPPSNYVGTNGPVAAALQQMGTNAIPCLRRLLKAKDSRLKARLIAFANKQRWVRIHITPADDRHRRAALATFCLGPRGSPLMPEIMGLFRSGDYQTSFTMAETLGRIGYCNPETLPALLAALNEPPNTPPGLHDRAAFALLCLSQCMEIVNVDRPDAFHEPGYKAEVPVLLKALNAPADMPLCLGVTLKPCCGGILKRIDPEAAAKAGVK